MASSSGTRRQADAVTGIETAPDDDASTLFYQPTDTTANQFYATLTQTGSAETYSLRRIVLEHDVARNQPRLRISLDW